MVGLILPPEYLGLATELSHLNKDFFLMANGQRQKLA